MPLSTNEALALPANAEVGVSDPRPGTGLSTSNANAVELPPAGGGLVTDICSVPALATSPALSVACSVVEFEKAVVRALPLTTTTDPVTKFLPEMVSVSAGPPAAADLGEIPVISGTALGFGLIVNTQSVGGDAVPAQSGGPPLVPPPG